MQGKDLRDLLEAHPSAKHHLSDANDYLVSYRFDTGPEVAFDPRTTKKCSVFLAKRPPSALYLSNDLVLYMGSTPVSRTVWKELKTSDPA